MTLKIRTRHLQMHQTPEGVTVPLFNSLDPWNAGIVLKMAYVSTIGPGMLKGPIVHQIRRTIVTSMDAHVKLGVIDPDDGVIHQVDLCDASGPILVDVGPTQAVAYRNTGSLPGMIIVLADHAWSPDEEESVKYDGWEAYLSALKA